MANLNRGARITGGARAVLVSVADLAERKGVTPKTVDDLACPDAFESDEEVDDFMKFVTEQRRENLV